MKKWLRMLVFFLVSAGVGFGVGFLIRKVQEGDGWDPAMAVNAAAPVLSVLICILFAAVVVGAFVFCLYRNHKVQEALRLNPNAMEDDEVDRLEEQLNLPVSIEPLMMVVGFMIFPLLIWLVQRPTVTGLLQDVTFIGTTVVFVLSMFASLWLGRASINLLKKLNPEKQGDLLDKSFSKTWINSMDEMEKAVTYRSGYKAYSVGTNCCLVLWLISVLMMMLLETDPTAPVMVTMIWLAMQIAYLREAAKQEKHE